MTQPQTTDHTDDCDCIVCRARRLGIKTVGGFPLIDVEPPTWGPYRKFTLRASPPTPPIHPPPRPAAIAAGTNRRDAPAGIPVKPRSAWARLVSLFGLWKVRVR